MWRSFTRIDYLWQETTLGLHRGGWMNWAAVITMTVLLFLFGLSVQLSWQLDDVINQFGNQLEISVYLDSGVAAPSLVPIVRSLPEVGQVVAISKEEAWQKLVQEMGLTQVQEVTQQLNGNPLVDQLAVKARSAAAVAALVAKLRQIAGVAEVLYIDEAVRQIGQLHRGLRGVSLGIVATLSLAALAVITTTIRLIALARRHEIEIMNLVGATRRWIHLPFLFQGVIFGLSGAALAWIMLAVLQQSLSRILAQQPELIRFVAQNLQLHRQELILLPLIMLGFGMTIGFLGSWLAIRRLV